MWAFVLPAKSAAGVIKAAFQLKVPLFEISAAVSKNESRSNVCLIVTETGFMGSVGKYCKKLNGKY